MIYHIGLPKCGSTTLQYIFANSDHKLLGCNPKNSPSNFYHSKIGNFLEGPLRFGTNKSYFEKSNQIKTFINDYSNKNNSKVILSYENISFRLTPWDLPTDIKFERLNKILIPKSTILFCFRNVLDFLLSLYKNHVSFGYTENFNYFIQEIIAIKDYGLLKDLNLENFFELISYHFKDHKVLLYNIDNRPDFSFLLNELNIKTNLDIIINQNKSPLLHETESIRAYNKSIQNRKNLLGWLESHRVFYKSNLDQDQIFEISRHRILQNKYLIERSHINIINQSIDWPEEILDLERKNSFFLNSKIFPDNFKLLI